ncbi:WD40 repeat domain-containing protein [Pokkaliibacter sp. CJK22405]|uniref:WD40 repeat domain-containing protein n=1 Tax=Pokkaliibacter sp. CJK22405 TaxID=3384615 RepID=UPI003984BD73
MKGRWRFLNNLGLCALTIVALGLAGCGERNPDQANEMAVQGLYSGALSPDGKYALIGSVAHGGSFWDIKSNERLYDWNHQAGVYSNLVAVDISANDARAITAENFDFVFWDATTGKALDFRRAPASIMDVSLAQDGKTAALGLENQTAVIFDVDAGKVTHSFVHDARVRKLDLNARAGLLLTADDSFNTYLWDLSTDTLRHKLSIGNQPSTVAISDNGALAFSAAQLSKAIVWDTVTGQVKYTLASMGSILDRKATFTAARFIDENQRLLTGTSSGKVMLWDMRTGSLEATWQLHRRNELKPVSVAVMSVASRGGIHHFAIGSNGFLDLLEGP